jgi:hypothetical protein
LASRKRRRQRLIDEFRSAQRSVRQQRDGNHRAQRPRDRPYPVGRDQSTRGRCVKAAFEAAMADPAASVRAGQKVKSDLETELSLEQLKVGISLMPSKASQGKPVGYMAPQDWTDTLQLMKQYMGLETNQKAEDFYTNQFVPNAPRG